MARAAQTIDSTCGDQVGQVGAAEPHDQVVEQRVIERAAGLADADVGHVGHRDALVEGAADHLVREQAIVDPAASGAGPPAGSARSGTGWGNRRPGSRITISSACPSEEGRIGHLPPAGVAVAEPPEVGILGVHALGPAIGLALVHDPPGMARVGRDRLHHAPSGPPCRPAPSVIRRQSRTARERCGRGSECRSGRRRATGLSTP